MVLQEAEDLRPLLVSELTSALDLFVRDRARKTYVLLRARLQPRLPFLGPLPAVPAPPIYVPGKGLVAAEAFIDLFFPVLTDQEKISLDTFVRFQGLQPDIVCICMSVQKLSQKCDVAAWAGRGCFWRGSC